MKEASDVERFFESLATRFDTASPFRWSFLLAGAAVDRVESLMAEVGAMGFNEVEVMLEEDERRFALWFAEVCVHSAYSFAQRVAAVEQLAAREGLVVADYSAEWKK